MSDRTSRAGGSHRILDEAPDIGRLADLLSGPLGDFAIHGLRVRPRQVRSVESVERLLSAAVRMTFRQRSADGFSIEKVAVEAGVTPQAAYRYFKDADELVRTGLRCVVIRGYERVVNLLSGRLLRAEAELARAVAAVVVEACGGFLRFPDHVRENVLQEYRQVGYDASTHISRLICKDVDTADVRKSLDCVKLSVAFTATIAVATSLFSKKIAPLRESRLEDVLTCLFVSVLRSDGSPSTAFREMEHEFDSSGAGERR